MIQNDIILLEVLFRNFARQTSLKFLISAVTFDAAEIDVLLLLRN